MSITEFVQSPGYKKAMGKVYGMGAAVVILGALFKIQHYPGASYMLVAGLGTEAVIFFLSAFEPPHEMPDWSLVYPELVGLEPSEHGGKGHGVSVSGGGGDLAALIEGGHIEEEVVKKLSDGLKKLGSTTSQLSDLGNATLATDSYLKNITKASDAVGQFTNSQIKTSKIVEESAEALSGSYSNIAKVVQDSGSKMGASADEFQNLNKNLSSLNSVLELQVKNSSVQATLSQELTQGMGEVKDQVLASVKDVKNYKDKVAELSSTISELNSIYGNMLSVMNVSR